MYPLYHFPINWPFSARGISSWSIILLNTLSNELLQKYCLGLQLTPHHKRQLLHSLYNKVLPYPLISFTVENKMMFLTKENNKKQVPSLICPFKHGVLNSTWTSHLQHFRHLLYTYRNGNYHTLQCDLQSVGHFSYVIMINIFASTICQ